MTRDELLRRRDEVRQRTQALEVARRLGLEPAPRSNDRHKFHCPKCGSSDALHCYPEVGRGMTCFACGADEFEVVRAALGCRFGAAIDFLASLAGAVLEAANDLPPALPRGERPDPAELGEFWDACRRVTHAADVAAWLRSRALDPELVGALDLVRVFPDMRLHRVPAWAWSRRRFALVTPLYDEQGRLASVRFRPVPGSGREARGPYVHGGPSYSLRGLVMACATGRQVLGGATPPTGALVIAEGEPDWMTWATRGAGAASFGIYNGGWSAELAARMPAGATVVIATHADEAGDHYARRLADTLRGRCDVRRLRPPQQPEACAR